MELAVQIFRNVVNEFVTASEAKKTRNEVVKLIVQSYLIILIFFVSQVYYQIERSLSCYLCKQGIDYN